MRVIIAEAPLVMHSLRDLGIAASTGNSTSFVVKVSNLVLEA